MNEIDIKYIWKAYDLKLEKSLSINSQILREITLLKVTKSINKMRPVKFFGLILGIIWIIFLDSIVINLWALPFKPFMISLFIISTFTKLAVGIYIYHLVLLSQINEDDSVVFVQERLARLKTSTLFSTRIMMLQIPFWSTWYIGSDFLNEAPVIFIILQVVVTISMSILAIWLFKNIKIENVEKPWMKLLFSGIEWDPITKAQDLLIQVKNNKN